MYWKDDLRMKSTMKTLFVFSIILLISGCARIPAGYRGVKVNLLGSSSGEIEMLNVGRYFYWPFGVEIYKFPVFQQNTVWSADESVSFQTVEGLTATADLGISYSIEPDSVPVLFQKYRRGIEEITSIFLRNMVVDAVNKVASSMTVEAVYGKGRQQLLDDVTKMVSRQVRPYGIVVDKIYAVGQFKLPQKVVVAIDAKIEATQRALQRENEIKEAEAEAAKKNAIVKGESEAVLIRAKAESEAILVRADAEAKANALRAASLTPTLLQYESIKKWSGNLPQATGGTAMPIFQINPFPGKDSVNNK
jgi:regulator of protease activity HflC (stomatin/prohibitin superfamily)